MQNFFYDQAQEAADHDFNARYDDNRERYAGEDIVGDYEDCPPEFSSCPLLQKFQFGFTLEEALPEIEEHNRFWGQLKVETAIRDRKFSERWAGWSF